MLVQLRNVMRLFPDSTDLPEVHVIVRDAQALRVAWDAELTRTGRTIQVHTTYYVSGDSETYKLPQRLWDGLRDCAKRWDNIPDHGIVRVVGIHLFTRMSCIMETV